MAGVMLPALRGVVQPVLRGVLDPPMRGSAGGGGDDDQLPEAILDMFANGEQGAWYDMDLSRLYQDAGGTVPVTALGQPVGRIEDRSPNGLHATQVQDERRPILPADGQPRLRSDFVDDVISTTLPADCEVWVNTPHGHYRAHGAAGLYHLPLNDCTHFLAIDRELSASERDSVAAYFGTPARWGCYLTPGTAVELICYSDGDQPDPVIHFAGANGATVTKIWSRDSIPTTMDLSADGLTSPVMVMPDAGYGSMYFYSQSNQFTGSIPDLSSNTALMVFYCNDSQLTGSIPDLTANTALVVFSCDFNQLTGSIPDLSANTELFAFYCNSNQITGYTGGGLGTNTNDMHFHDNALTQEAVDLLLSDLVDAGHDGGRIFLNQGTNSPPSAQGLDDVATLRSRGWQVQVNT